MRICLVTGNNSLLLCLFEFPEEVSYALKSSSLVFHLCPHLFLWSHWCLCQGWWLKELLELQIPRNQWFYTPQSPPWLKSYWVYVKWGHFICVEHFPPCYQGSTFVYVPLLTTSVVTSYSSDPAWVASTWLIINTHQRYHAPSWFPLFPPGTWTKQVPSSFRQISPWHTCPLFFGEIRIYFRFQIRQLVIFYTAVPT